MRPMTLAACVALTIPLAAQFPIGHATPVSGYAPALFAEPLWIGNTGYGYRIQGAPPGGAAFIAVTQGRQDQVISGLQVYLDLGNVVATHSATLDGAGRATIAIPLGSPDEPGLAGLQFYAQGAVSDPATNALGATEAVLLEVTNHPLLAFTAWAGSLFLVDPVSGTTTPVAAMAAPQTIRDAVFGNGGRDLFLATSTGVAVVDTVAASPQAVTLLAGGYAASLAWDRIHQRLYVLDAQAQALLVLDGNRSSPTFGSVIAQTPDASSWVALSADGNQLALTTFPGVLTRRDANPDSAGYLQLLPTPPTPFTTPFGTTAGRLHLSPDGRVVTIPLQQGYPSPTTFLHRFETVTGTWLDHDPVAAGYQPLAAATYPGLPTSFAFHATRDGSAAILTSHSATPSSRVDFDLLSPLGLTTTATPVPFPPGGFITFAYLGLTPSGRFLLRREVNLFTPNPATLSLVEVATGGQTPLFTNPGGPSGGQPPIAVWR